MQILTRGSAAILGLVAVLSFAPLRAQPAAVLNLELGQNAKGSAAIAALGDKLPTVAQAYGLSPQKLIELLRMQADLGVDRHGHLHYICAGLALSPTDAEVVDAVSTDIASTAGGATAADVFRLHSLPGANRVIYLDFNGHVTSGTQWNTSFNNGADIVSAAFDLDGDPSTFSATERGVMQRIWQRVSEDYAPFAVDVTTEDPGLEALRRTSSTDQAYGVRVVVSPTNWYGSAGGVSYLGAFNWNSDTPSYAFTANLANSEKPIAEACSHEAGHALGLHHDGLTSGTTYYGGQGNWAPIMGNSYSKAVTQWCRGEYANANNTEDQLAVIPTYGAPQASDDHGNTLATATVLAGTSLSTGGTIETRGDVDVFRFDTGAGAIQLSVRSPAPESNLTLKAELLDSAGNVLLSGTSTTGVSFNPTLAAGTYYLRLDGVGSGDPLSTGYSDYASLGNYLVTGTLVASGANQPPVAVVSTSTTSGTAPVTVSFNGGQSYDADGSIATYAWNFGNGQTASGSTASCTYSAAGTYIAVLTVTDNQGATASASTTITVQAAPVATVRADVADFSLTTDRRPNGMAGVATVTVRDSNGQPVANAAVTITWSGVVSGTASGFTDASGRWTATSARTKKGGTATATVTLGTSNGVQVDASLYAAPTTLSVRLN